LGILFGLWFGVSFGPKIVNGMNILESWLAWMFNMKRIDNNRDK
jgi:hypothetical protein